MFRSNGAKLFSVAFSQMCNFFLLSGLASVLLLRDPSRFVFLTPITSAELQDGLSSKHRSWVIHPVCILQGTQHKIWQNDLLILFNNSTKRALLMHSFNKRSLRSKELFCLGHWCEMLIWFSLVTGGGRWSWFLSSACRFMNPHLPYKYS